MKLVNYFIYLKRWDAATESDANKLIGKAWAAIDNNCHVSTIAWLHHLDS